MLDIGQKPTGRLSCATMSRRIQRTLAPAIILMTLVTGLVVAQEYAGFYGDPDGVLFPGPISSRDGRSGTSPANRPGRDSELAKSLQLAREISTLDSIDDFLTFAHEIKKDNKPFFLNSRIGESEERSNAEQTIPAKCMPELQPVPLKMESDPSSMYYPPCTRVKRCGGCCSHALLSCQPTTWEVRNFEVAVLSIDKSTGSREWSKRIVPLEEHTKCVCDCRIKAEHCNSKQSYVPEECRCECNNGDEQEKCIKNNHTKLWNPDDCTCTCREVQECSTGLYFDQNACRCQQVPFSRTWFPATKGTDYRFGQTQKPDTPPVIIALDAADPRRKPKEDPEYN